MNEQKNEFLIKEYEEILTGVFDGKELKKEGINNIVHDSKGVDTEVLIELPSKGYLYVGEEDVPIAKKKIKKYERRRAIKKAIKILFLGFLAASVAVAALRLSVLGQLSDRTFVGILSKLNLNFNEAFVLLGIGMFYLLIEFGVKHLRKHFKFLYRVDSAGIRITFITIVIGTGIFLGLVNIEEVNNILK
ncbi:MAG: hypothetical protein A2675_00380 [Candidatus Yonathbacteria bacterium RIFCSPHIGHO2_01_FULL_51_10]|uniref:Uncharacterized protein n=1 Tax=Candidatus Yonathbacteria bacterium RIFCSPHIGHO2_01_FULL_51_10 TaxID=1802723 RepID=A0A1G2SB49_9BACT|nr:MAG: hypothetical protein A2675_00380 [Candidatus Yonathbacteria bacterium RIFCSPHIGHO2_01_FULL_51_10]